jgi:hypothetical protein
VIILKKARHTQSQLGNGFLGKGRNTADLVECDVAQVADLLDLGSSQTERANVPQSQMVVRAVSLKLVSLSKTQQGLGECLRVLNHLRRVFFELGRSSLLESNSDGGNRLVVKKQMSVNYPLHDVRRRAYMIVRAALRSREDSVVDTLLEFWFFIFAEENQTSTRAAQSLVTVGQTQLASVKCTASTITKKKHITL